MLVADIDQERRGGGNMTQGPASEAAARDLYRHFVRPLLGLGMSQTAIADTLNTAGIKAIRGGPWSQSRISALLRRVGIT